MVLQPIHLEVSVHSRSRGHSSVASAAYRAGERLHDASLGTTPDYRRKGGVLRDAGELILPAGAPAWDREQVWNEVEARETNKDGTAKKKATVAREVVIALPHELDAEQRQKLGVEFARWLSDKYGIVADIQFHKPGKKGDQRNFHAHILMSTRVLGSGGFGEKVRILDSMQTRSIETLDWRREYADRQNAALEAAGSDVRVTHLSHADRGLAEQPTIHEGKAATHMKRKAEKSGKAYTPSKAQQHNAEVREYNALLAERAAVEAALKIAEANEFTQISEATLDAFENPVRAAAMDAIARIRTAKSERAPVANLGAIRAHLVDREAKRAEAERGQWVSDALALAAALRAKGELPTAKTAMETAGKDLAASVERRKIGLPRNEILIAHHRLVRYKTQLTAAKGRLARAEARRDAFEARQKQRRFASLFDFNAAKSKAAKQREQYHLAVELARELVAFIMSFFGVKDVKETASRPIAEVIDARIVRLTQQHETQAARIRELEAVIAAAPERKSVVMEVVAAQYEVWNAGRNVDRAEAERFVLDAKRLPAATRLAIERMQEQEQASRKGITPKR